MRRSTKIGLTAALSLTLLPLGASSVRAEGETNCEMTFVLKGWSAGYKTAHGEGTIHCANGESAEVSIKVTGGGLTVGKTETTDGLGKFSPVAKLDELLGSYAAAMAEAGAVKSAEAQALTKGNVSLALSGTGSGWSLGVSGAKFTIARK